MIRRDPEWRNPASRDRPANADDRRPSVEAGFDNPSPVVHDVTIREQTAQGLQMVGAFCGGGIRLLVNGLFVAALVKFAAWSAARP